MCGIPLYIDLMALIVKDSCFYLSLLFPNVLVKSEQILLFTYKSSKLNGWLLLSQEFCLKCSEQYLSHQVQKANLSLIGGHSEEQQAAQSYAETLW